MMNHDADNGARKGNREDSEKPSDYFGTVSVMGILLQEEHATQTGDRELKPVMQRRALF
jgi:hypothetical protein